MKRAALILALFCGVASAQLVEDNPSRPVQGDASGLRDLTPGRYELVLSGVLCSACVRGVAKEFAAEPAVAFAKPDLDHRQVVVEIKPGKKLPASRVKRVLKRASRRVNLGSNYGIAAVHYSLTPLEPGSVKK